ncbi:hypothetical protein C8Q74DRAFT_937016 [Fomes fomentarius]|nr:hypothetical protein C8Q74DRAFT_937016 [Fomes fomentarius]
MHIYAVRDELPRVTRYSLRTSSSTSSVYRQLPKPYHLHTVPLTWLNSFRHHQSSQPSSVCRDYHADSARPSCARHRRTDRPSCCHRGQSQRLETTSCTSHAAFRNLPRSGCAPAVGGDGRLRPALQRSHELQAYPGLPLVCRPGR